MAEEHRTEHQRGVEEAVAIFQKYVATYTKQEGWRDYSEKTFVNDMVYGIGIALSPNYEFAVGWRNFKTWLVRLLNE